MQIPGQIPVQSNTKLLLSMLTDVGSVRGVDVLVTTHNPALLDAMGTEMVPFITVAHRDKTLGYSKLTLLEDVGPLPKLLARGTVGTLSSQGLIETAVTGRTRIVSVPRFSQHELDFSSADDVQRRVSDLIGGAPHG
jgi:hypothetical protein